MNIPTKTVQHWLDATVDHTDTQARIDAIERVIECFGSFELAERYIELNPTTPRKTP